MWLKALFGATWGLVALAAGVRILSTGLARTIRACGQGLMWGEIGRRDELPSSTHALLWLFHAGGLAFLWRLCGRDYPHAIPFGLLTSLLLALPQLAALRRRRVLDATPLTSLVVPYGLVALRLAGLVPALTAQELLPWVSLAAVAYALLAEVERAQQFSRSRAGIPFALVLMLTPVAAWVLVEYLGACTRGVTGSDPYCYVQMAVDWAQHGDLRHAYSLFPLVRSLGISWWPIVHVGYYPPDAVTGAAPTVWPPGWPVLLSVGYLLLGERGLYYTAPFLGLLALVATAGLLLEVVPGKARRRWLAAGLAAAILATSRVQVLQVLVPMADVPAQLFTVLAIWLALRSGRRQSRVEAALAGLALGVAYDIRHTQVVLVPILVLALASKGLRRRCVPLVLAAGMGCLLAVVPDLIYHASVFGSIWHAESPEVGLISIRYWWPNAQRMAHAAAASAEFGLLLLPLGYGAWRLWHENRHACTVLLLWGIVNAGSQLLYGPVRFRDLLSALPPLAVLSAYGAVMLVEWARTARRLPGWAPGWMAFAVATLLAVRTGPIVDWPLRQVEMNFGYMTTPQRNAFRQLASAVEPNAVVGTALNSGAVDLYAGRETFRPGDWSQSELDEFLAAMSAAGKPVYVLDDGNEQAAVVDRLQKSGRLEPVCALDVPLYGSADELSGMLYRVQ